MAEGDNTGDTGVGNTEKKVDSQLNEVKDLLTEQKNLIEGLFPKGTAAGLGGDITVGDTFGYVAEQVAYHGLNSISLEISKNVSTKLKAMNENLNEVKILLVNDLNIAKSAGPYFEVETSHKLLKEIFDDLDERFRTQIKDYEELSKKRIEPAKTLVFGIPGSPPVTIKFSEIEGIRHPFAPIIPVAALAAGLSAAPGVVSALSGMAGQFRSDYTVKSREIKINIQALISSVAGYLASKSMRIYILNNYPLGEQDLNVGVMKKFEELYKKSRTLSSAAVKISDLVTKEKETIELIKGELKKLESLRAEKKPEERQDLEKIDIEISNKKSDIREGEDWLQNGEALIKEQDLINTELITTLKNFTTVETGKEFSKFALATLWEKTIQRIQITHILFVNIVSGGGEAITMKSIWKSGNTSFIGGFVVSYALETQEGEILLAGTCPSLHAFDYNITPERNNIIRPIEFKEK